MVQKIDHIAIAVKDLDKAVKLYADLFGVKPSKIETIPSQKVKAALITIGRTEVEILEPFDPTSPVAKFIEKKGEGLHHIALRVKDVDRELAKLSKKGVELIDQKGRKGLAGKIGFLHPKSTGSVLIELVQKIKETKIKKIKVLLAKAGLDGHDRGIKIIARALRDAGMEVIYTGIRQTPEMIVQTALEEDVNIIGLSSLSGAHLEHFPNIIEGLKKQGMRDVVVIAGGIIPEEDIPILTEAGVKAVFGPATKTQEIIDFIQSEFKEDSS